MTLVNEFNREGLKSSAADRPAAASHSVSKWPEILWREWRTCEDEAYAHRLFDLVGETAVGWGSVATIALASTLYGLLAGYLLGLIAINRNLDSSTWILSGTMPLVLAWLGGIGGGLIGVWASQWLTWRVWLGLLTPNVFGKKMGGLSDFNPELLAGFIFGLIQPNPLLIGFLLGGLLSRLRFGKEAGRKVLTGALASGVGALIGAAVGQDAWLGVGLGLVVGGWLGGTGGSGPLGIGASWLGLLLGLVAFGLDDWLVSWLGIGAGFGLGIIPNALGQGIDAVTAYRYRSWYFWWRGQPPMTKVEGALHLAGATRSQSQEEWADLLLRLKEQKAQPGQPELLIAALSSEDWITRFTARYALVALGGEAVEALRRIASDSTHRLQQTALWLLTSIEQDTTNRLAWRLRQLLCPRCLARYGARSVSLTWGISFTYCGCRICGQSREFLEWLQVVAVLDETWAEAQLRQDNQLRINWLTRRTLFDFDRVELVQATDEDVERFAVQVGNDTDPFRAPRYKRVPCIIGPACHLSENTLRILERTFGAVEILTHNTPIETFL